MKALQWRRVIEADLRKVAAEPLFWLILLAPFLIGWAMRHLLPYLAGQFHSFALDQYYPLIVALLILTPPLYYGMILALQVLEEKDEAVLCAVAVTPIRLRTYLAARIFMYTVISLPLIVLVHEIIDVVEIETAKLIWIAVAASLNTPLVVMLLAAFCNNQLEGFVLGKGMGFFILFPLAMFFVPDYWHLICGILPTYWPIIAYFTAAADSESTGFFYFAVVMAMLVQPMAIVWLYRRFASGLSG